ncbi:hypothetical protein Tco_1399952 [Tanacetum coccineum]
MASNIKNFKCLIHFNETQRGSILSEDLTYSMLHEMVMKKFNLEANAVINLSFKLSSFDSAVDITDDAEMVEKGKIFDNKNLFFFDFLAVRLLKALGRLTVLMKLQEAIDKEAILKEQILALMHRFADRFTDRRVKINNLIVLQDHALVDYGKYTLGCMTGADMKKCVYLKSVRDELLRSMEEKRQLMANYRDM